jgi:protein SCO1
MNKQVAQQALIVLRWMDRAALSIALTIICMSFGSHGVIAKDTALPPGTPPSIGGVLDHVGISPTMGHQVPLDLQFVDATGKRIDLRKCVAGRPTVLQLVYFQCPMLCQLSRDGLMGTLATISLKPGQDFSVITLSFDPREGPELSARAKQLAVKRCGQAAVDAGWHFLTADQAAIATLCEAVGFRYMFDEKTGQFAHAAGVFVLTPEGRVSRFLSGTDYSPRSLRLALVDAGSGKVGNWADQAMLLCYMYDPTTGKYGLAIMSMMRLAGAATVATLAGGILLMIRRDRTRNTTEQCAMSQAALQSVLD